jgi:hypothetical protein
MTPHDESVRVPALLPAHDGAIARDLRIPGGDVRCHVPIGSGLAADGAVRAMKIEGSGLLSTIGSVSLCGSLLRAGLVDRVRVVMFPVITGATGAERIYDGYPDVTLEMIDHRTFDGSIQLVEYRPTVLEHPPLGTAAS